MGGDKIPKDWVQSGWVGSGPVRSGQVGSGPVGSGRDGSGWDQGKSRSLHFFGDWGALKILILIFVEIGEPNPE